MKLLIYIFIFLCILEARKKLKKREMISTKVNMKNRQTQALPQKLFIDANYPSELIAKINPEQIAYKPGFTECNDDLHTAYENCFSPGKLYGNLPDKNELNKNIKIALNFLNPLAYKAPSDLPEEEKQTYSSRFSEEQREIYAYNLGIKNNPDDTDFATRCKDYKAITLYTSNNEIFCRQNNFATSYPKKIKDFKDSLSEPHLGLLELEKFRKRLKEALENYQITSPIPSNIFSQYISGKTDEFSKYLASKTFSIRGGSLQALKEYLDGAPKGNIVHIDGFLSTSFDVAKAIDYMGSNSEALLIGFGDIVARGKSAGAMIQDCSVYKAEAEFLLKLNTDWKYIGKVNAFTTKNYDGQNVNIDLHVLEFYEPNPSDKVQENCVIGDFDNADLNRQNAFVYCEENECKNLILYYI